MKTIETIKNSTTSGSKAVGGQIGKAVILKVIENPAILKTVTNYATTLTTKLASQVTTRYPKFINLMIQGLDSLEAKLKEHYSEVVSNANSTDTNTTNATAGMQNKMGTNNV